MLMKKMVGVACAASLLALAACGKDEPGGEVAVVEDVAVAEAAAAPQDRPVLMAVAREATNARVEAIDHATRAVTLLPEGGEPFTLTAPEEAHNLDQIQVGDTITLEYTQSLTIEIVEAEAGTEPSAAAVVAGNRAEKGATPAGGVMGSEVTVSIVEDINLENNTFKLKMPDGEVREFTARNPANLKLAKVGDAVVVTNTETLTMALTAKAGDAPATQSQ